MRKVMFRAMSTIFTLLLANLGTVNGQGILENYTVEKRIKISIGREEGEVMVRYLFLGCSVDFPRSIAFDYEGSIIIGSSMQRSRVQKFDNSGRFLKVIAYAGEAIDHIGEPQQIRIDKENYIYIGDANHMNIGSNFLLKKFDREGHFLGTIEKKDWKNERRRGLDSSIQEKMVTDFWISSMGNVYIQDDRSSRVLSFNDKGEYLGEADYFLTNSNGDVFVESDHNQWSKYVLSDQEKRLPNSIRYMNQIEKCRIEFESNYSIEFIGFDRHDNMYFWRKGIITHTEEGASSEFNRDYAFFKYSAGGDLLALMDLPDSNSSRLHIDPDGNVYQLYVIYATYKELTHGDHIEIVKWAPQTKSK